MTLIMSRRKQSNPKPLIKRKCHYSNTIKPRWGVETRVNSCINCYLVNKFKRTLLLVRHQMSPLGSNYHNNIGSSIPRAKCLLTTQATTTNALEIDTPGSDDPLWGVWRCQGDRLLVWLTSWSITVSTGRYEIKFLFKRTNGRLENVPRLLLQLPLATKKYQSTSLWDD